MIASFLLAVRPALLLLSFLVKPVPAQDVIAAMSDNATELAALILKPGASGVAIVKAELVGNAAQFGTYAYVGNMFRKLPSTGVVLSSGKVVDVSTAVFAPNTEFDNSVGDADLDKELKKINANYASLDAAVLLIQVKVSRPVAVSMAFVFGSYDLPIYGFTAFPDIFGLFLDGTNVALMGDKPVSVATVYCDANGGVNCDQLVTNGNRVGTSLTGYTKTQTTTLNLSTGIHEIKVAVADGGLITDVPNRAADGAVFLSFIGTVQAPTAAPISVQAPTAAPTSGKRQMMNMMNMMMMMMT
jgi:hypothetical protein